MTARKLIPNYTVQDYQSWKGECELWQGIPVSMTPSPFGPHSAVVVKIITFLVNQLRNCDATVLTELDWIVDNHTVIRPGHPIRRLHDSFCGLETGLSLGGM